MRSFSKRQLSVAVKQPQSNKHAETASLYAVADETVNTEELAAESAEAASKEETPAPEAEAPVEEKPAAAKPDDMPLPDGFEMPDLSDLDAMMKEAGL